MTDNNNNNTANRDMYWVMIKYDMPVAASFQLYADSKEHAVEMLKHAHSEIKNFEVVDAYQLTAEQEQEAAAGFQTNEDTEKVLN